MYEFGVFGCFILEFVEFICFVQYEFYYCYIVDIYMFYVICELDGVFSQVEFFVVKYCDVFYEIFDFMLFYLILLFYDIGKVEGI